jgi:hypothetical protein
MSHYIKNILQGLQGGADTVELGLRSSNLKIAETGWIIVNRNLDKIQHLMLNMLAYSKEREPRLELMQINSIVNDVLDLTRKRADDRGVMLITDLVPSMPHMCLFVSGPPGSAKSTFARLEKDIIDPSEVDVMSLPKDERELIRALDRSYLCSFDNLSNILRDRSDMLCQAITGAAVMTRRLFTDDDDYMRKFRTIVRLNGISSEIRESDLLERTILMELREITGASRKS